MKGRYFVYVITGVATFFLGLGALALTNIPGAVWSYTSGLYNSYTKEEVCEGCITAEEYLASQSLLHQRFQVVSLRDGGRIGSYRPPTITWETPTGQLVKTELCYDLSHVKILAKNFDDPRKLTVQFQLHQSFLRSKKTPEVWSRTNLSYIFRDDNIGPVVIDYR